jgi:hypothetical protein
MRREAGRVPHRGENRSPPCGQVLSMRSSVTRSPPLPWNVRVSGLARVTTPDRSDAPGLRPLAGGLPPPSCVVAPCLRCPHISLSGAPCAACSRRTPLLLPAKPGLLFHRFFLASGFARLTVSAFLPFVYSFCAHLSRTCGGFSS